jgi:uncharacterized protein (TIGR00255 family)
MHSMTGFGRGSSSAQGWQATVEISAVNRKQAEVVVQVPRELSELESAVRSEALAAVSRGRIQISIALTRAETSPGAVKVDVSLARAFDQAFHDLGLAIGRPLLPTAADFIRQPGILNVGGDAPDAAAAWAVIQPALQDALRQLREMRAREGADLKDDFLTRLEVLHTLVKKISTAAPGRPHRQRELLTKRLRDLGIDLDLSDERLVRELAIFAERCDISEELTRLDSHFTRFREYLDAPEPTGRALDFLCQELFREFNTIGSKANDAAIAQTVVEAKTELEKVREQVQNIE